MRTIIKLSNFDSNSAYYIGVEKDKIVLYATSLNYFHNNKFNPIRTLELWDGLYERVFLFYPDLSENNLKYREWYEYSFSYDSLPEEIRQYLLFM